MLTQIILGRIEKKIDGNLVEDQFGFRKNRSIREAIFCLQSIAERNFTVNKKLCIAFVILLKAFDNVNWNIMM